MVKEAKVGNVTAAIGDGGNDISMIQEAHVGLGIVGLEGNAAAKAADFAFTKVQGDISGQEKPSLDLVMTVLATGWPLL